MEGHFGEDDFRVGFGENEIHITGQTLGLIRSIEFMDSTYDAIIGLAYPTMSDSGLPIFDMMMEQNLL